MEITAMPSFCLAAYGAYYIENNRLTTLQTAIKMLRNKWISIKWALYRARPSSQKRELRLRVTIFVVAFCIVPMNESFMSSIGVIDLPPVNSNLYFPNFCSCSTISKSPSVFEGLPRSDCQYEALLRWMNLNHLQKDGYNFGMLSTL